MRLILQGNGRLAIDILAPSCETAEQNQDEFQQVERPTAESALRLDLNACASLEEALFAGAAILLQQHYTRTRTAPSRNVSAAARQIFEVLVERGDLPETGTADTTFLAKLLAVLEQITDDSGKPYFTGLIAFVRDLIIGDDDGENSPSGSNGHSGNNEGSSDGDDEPPAGKPGGNNGTPSNGSSL